MGFGSRHVPVTLALVILVVANLTDGIVTLVLLQLHLAEELNPLLARAYGVSPVVFMVVKLCLMQGSLLFIMLVPDRPALKRRVVRASACMFLTILCYQVLQILRP